MKFIFLFLFSSTIYAEDLTKCQKNENGSLWVEEYSCNRETNVQVGHELFNDSLVITRKGVARQEYEEKEQKINVEYIKQLKGLKTGLTQ